MKTLKEKIEVMQWFEDGGEINVGSLDNLCQKSRNPVLEWNWHLHDYSIVRPRKELWKCVVEAGGVIVHFDTLEEVQTEAQLYQFKSITHYREVFPEDE